jgi:hypothetical protein
VKTVHTESFISIQTSVFACAVAGCIHCFDVDIRSRYVWGSGRDIEVTGFGFCDYLSSMG